MLAQARSSICQTNREPLVYTVTIFSVVLHCIQLQIIYFLRQIKDNANFGNFYQRTNRALQLYANYMVFDITCVNRNLDCFYAHLADLSRVRYKTSTWNEIEERIKSNYMIVPSVLNKRLKNDMEWLVRDKAIFRRARNCTLERNWNEQP